MNAVLCLLLFTGFFAHDAKFSPFVRPLIIPSLAPTSSKCSLSVIVLHFSHEPADVLDIAITFKQFSKPVYFSVSVTFLGVQKYASC
jgi:hypothetical protein